MSNVSLLDPSVLKAGLTDGMNLKPSLTTDAYSGGIPQASSEIKPGLLGTDGNLAGGLLTRNGQLKQSLLK